MKRRFLLFALALPALPSAAQYEHCGNDFNCYYQERARLLEMEEARQEQEEDRRWAERMQLQEAQLEEMQQQNSVLKEELGELNQRQGKLEELQTRQLEEIKRLQEPPSRRPKQGNRP